MNFVVHSSHRSAAVEMSDVELTLKFKPADMTKTIDF